MLDNSEYKILGIRIDEGAITLLMLLLIADLAFICFHVFYLRQMVRSTLFSIETDLGYAEVYQYIKEYWIAFLLFVLAIKRRHLDYLSWTLLFVYLLFDDALQIHEMYGDYLARYFELKPMFGLRAVDFGELAISALAGGVLFSLIELSYLFSNKVAKRTSKHLFILVMSIAFFGVFVDMLHIAITWGTAIWGLIEDGGEMFIMSLIVWYVFTSGNAINNTQRI